MTILSCMCKILGMNYGSKKAIIKACYILEIIFLVFLVVSEILIVSLGFWLTSFAQTQEQAQLISKQLLVMPTISFLVSVIISTLFIIYLNKKSKQTKQQFYEKTKLIKFISIIIFIFNPITSIFLMIVAFKKDDGKEEMPEYKRPKKIKKNKPNFSKNAKKEIKMLKSQKRKGLISEELYNKKYQQIIKKEKQLQ